MAVSFQYFESEYYCAGEIAEKMRLVVYGKDQLYKNWYLISLKLMFFTEFVQLQNALIPKMLTFLCAERSCADLTEQYINIKLKVRIQVSKFLVKKNPFLRKNK